MGRYVSEGDPEVAESIEKQDPEGEVVLPNDARMKGLKGFYYNPYTQCVMLGFVCFLEPGLFNALNGLGGGGQIDAATSANSNAALYATFSVMAFFAGYELHRIYWS